MEPPVSPYSTPDLAEQYPYILITGGRHIAYFHSAYRQVRWLRELCPDPVIQVNPEAAERIGVKNGDWVWVETPCSSKKVKFKVEITLSVHPKVVHTQSHWWFPEVKEPYRA